MVNYWMGGLFAALGLLLGQAMVGWSRTSEEAVWSMVSQQIALAAFCAFCLGVTLVFRAVRGRNDG